MSRLSRSLVLLAASLMIIAGVLTTAAATPADDDASTGDCILSCYFGDDGGCGELSHTAPKEGDTNEYGGGWHYTCWEGTCDYGVIGSGGGYIPAKHPSCTGFGDDVDDLLDALSAADLRGITERAEALGGRIRIVPERSAIQVLGCDGTIFAHIPANEFALKAVTAE